MAMVRRHVKLILLTSLPALGVLLLVLLLSMRPSLSVADLTRDMTTTAGLHPLAGLLSDLGVLLWCVATAVCAFAALSLRGIGTASMVRFFASGALLSAYLMVDDFFLIHEHMGSILGIGWGEHLVYAVLGVAVLAYLAVFQRIILAAHYPLLVMGLGCLGASVVVDMFQPWLLWMGGWRNLMEDGAKWLGIVGWCAFHVFTVKTTLLNVARVRNDMKPPAQKGPVGKEQWRYVGYSLGVGLMVLTVMVLGSIIQKVDISFMTRDVASIAQVSPLTGLLSNLGVLLWCATAASCGITAYVAWRTGDTSRARFFLASGVLTTYLLLDDFFLIHEHLAFRYLGLRERYVLLFLAMALFAWLVGYRQAIQRTAYGYLFMALCFFALSVVVDGLLVRLFPDLDGHDMVYLVEDGFKWLGIASWFVYHVSTSLDTMRDKLASR